VKLGVGVRVDVGVGVEVLVTVAVADGVGVLVGTWIFKRNNFSAYPLLSDFMYNRNVTIPVFISLISQVSIFCG